MKKKKSKMRVFGKEESVRKLTEVEVPPLCLTHLLFGATAAFAIYGPLASLGGRVEEERNFFWHFIV